MAKLNLIKKGKNKTTLPSNRWKVLIADDEIDVHTLTKSVLKNFRYDGKSLEFLSSFNTEETIKILKENPDISLILLDVVMDSDDAGLNIVKIIREELKNDIIQIVLRTGQPGSAPEAEVVINYGINDYKEKTELTSKKLITTIVTSLRTYKTLNALEIAKKGLQKVIKSSDDSQNIISSQLFIKGILTQIISLLKINHNSIVVEHLNGLNIEKKNAQYNIIESTGKFSKLNNFDDIKEDTKNIISLVIKNKEIYFEDNIFVGFLKIDDNTSNIIYIEHYETLSALDKSLIEMFFKHSSTRLDNIRLNMDIFETQRSLIEILGDAVEKRYIDDPCHIKRVSKMSYLLATKYGLSEKEAKCLQTVSPMHDLGKIGISDSILLKPGKLTKEEFEVIKTHTSIGYEILKGTDKPTLNHASIVALEHHERWDGNGYPNGLKGEEISVFGRLISVIDVFDALYNKRCYKDAWEIKEIIKYFAKEKAKQFDPEMTELFLENIDEFIQIQKKYQS
jgi:response regulator RpfG family c-di-GMP phosphodiesterase